MTADSQVIDDAFQAGLEAALQVIKHHLPEGEVEDIAEAAVELAVDVAKHETLKALES